MPLSLAPIPQGVSIVDKAGTINDFFRLRWQSLIDSFQTVPTIATVQKLGLTAALATTTLYTTKNKGLYRLSYYIRKMVAGGVSSSLTVTLGWVETAIPLTESSAALTLDTTGAEQSGTKLVWADAATDLTIAVAYASNAPNTMTYRVDAVVEAPSL